MATNSLLPVALQRHAALATTRCLEGQTVVRGATPSRVRRRSFTTFVVIAVAALVLPAAGGAQGWAAAGSPRGQLKSAKVDAAGLAVSFPSEWIRVSLTDEDLESLGEALDEEGNREVSESIARVDASMIEFQANDPVDGDSVTVMVVPGALVGGGKFVKAQIEAEVGGAPGFELVRFRGIKVGDRRGFRADYRYDLILGDDEGRWPIYEVGVLLPADDGEIVHIDIAVDDDSEGISTADRVARSVRPL